MDFVNICLCGAQHGYPHSVKCPFPYYGSDPKRIDEWSTAHEERIKWFVSQPCAHPKYEILANGDLVCIDCGENILESIDRNGGNNASQ